MPVVEASPEIRLKVDVVVAPVPASTPLKSRNLAPWILIVGFLGSLQLLAYGTFVRQQPPFEQERARHPYPPFPTKRYEMEDGPRWTEMALMDYLGYRDVLMNANRQVHLGVFGEPGSNFTWIGTDGWLYLNVSDPNRGHHDKPSLDDRLTKWAVEYAERAKWCRDNGMEFVVLLAPEKSSVYPEYLTVQQRRSLPAVEVHTRMKELLQAHGVRCVDPLPKLLEEKPNGFVYFRNDTHWNQFGALVSERLLMKELGSTASEDYTVEFHETTGDLNHHTGTTATCLAPFYTHNQRKPVWDFAHASRDLLPPKARFKHLPPKMSTNPQASGPSLVLLHDSYGENMFDFLYHDCKSLATAASDNFEKAYILGHRPQVVVQEIVMRKLYRWVPEPITALRTPH